MNFQVDGILFRVGCSFKELVIEIAKQLGKDAITTFIDIRYPIKDGCPLITVYNDIGVRLYTKLKKLNLAMVDYPFCISFKDKPLDAGSTNINRVTTYFEELEITTDMLLLIQLDIVDKGSTGSEEENNIIYNPLHKKVDVGLVYGDKSIIITVIKHYAIQNKF